MQALIRFSLKNTSVLLLVTLIVTVAGVLAARGLKQELLPDINFPVITVITPYPLAGPEAVEAQVSRPLENALQGLPGIETLTSTSNANVSVIVLQFSFGVDLASVETQVAAAVNRARSSLPFGVQAPTVSAIRFGDSPVLKLALSSERAADLRARVDARVLPALRGVAGVARVDLTGVPAAQVRVTLDEAALARYRLEPGQVGQAIQAATLAFPVGEVRDGQLDVPVRLERAATTVADLAGVIVTAVPEIVTAVPDLPAGAPASPAAARTGAPATTAAAGTIPRRLRPVLLSEIASVRLTTAPATSITRLDGDSSVGLAVYKTQRANTLQVTRAVQALVPELETAVDGRITVLSDQGEPIAEGVSGLLTEGGLGGLFAVLVVLFFLGDVRSTLVTALSIPLSLIVALILLQVQGLSLNVLTLGGLTIAIGRVIDDALVVIENIFRKLAEGREAGISPILAAFDGAREVATPVTASTITTVAVFLPLAFVGGIAGEFFRPLALAVTWAILASLLIAFTVVPLLASLFLRSAPSGANRPSLLERLYRPAIAWVSDHRAATVLIAALALGAALVPLATGAIPTNLIGGGEPTSVEASLRLPRGTPLETANAQAVKLEARLAGLRRDGVVESYQTVVGGADNAFALAFGAGTGAAVSFTVLPAGGVKVEDLRARLQTDLAGASDGELTLTSGAGGGGFSQNLDVQIRADDAASLQAATARVLEVVRGVPEVRNPKSNLAAVNPELSVRVDQSRAYAAGVIPLTVAGAVRQALQGSVATTLRVNDEALDVVLAFPEGRYATVEQLRDLELRPAAGGAPVRLSSIAAIETVPGPSSIVRIDGERTASVSAEPVGTNVGAATAALSKALRGVQLDGASWSIGGVSASQAESFQALGIAILAAIALVYLVMVATFGSLMTPLLLLASIPLVAVGAFPLLAVTGTPIGLPVFFGFLLLVGIVVTNAIVLIDLVEQLRARGLEPRAAVIEGGARRVRPIVMTALTTILGLAPLAVGLSPGGGIVGKPLAVTVIGGLASSTLLTLLVVPALYLGVEGLRRRLRRGRPAARPLALGD